MVDPHQSQASHLFVHLILFCNEDEIRKSTGLGTTTSLMAEPSLEPLFLAQYPPASGKSPFKNIFIA